jgi:D-ribose pyranase
LGVIQSGILNPHLLALLARVRHTNTLVIADSMFPHWPGLVEVDLSLVPGVPTVPQVVAAMLANWKAGAAWMAEEFQRFSDAGVQREFAAAFRGVTPRFEPHADLKQRVPRALGLIRTGEARIYTNVVLESA